MSQCLLRTPLQLYRRNQYITILKCILTELGSSTLPAVCFVKPVPGVFPPQLSGSDKHTRDDRWRWLLPAERQATSEPSRCLDSVMVWNTLMQDQEKGDKTKAQWLNMIFVEKYCNVHYMHYLNKQAPVWVLVSEVLHNNSINFSKYTNPKQKICYDKHNHSWSLWQICFEYALTIPLPESTVYLRASWATMLTRPSNREAKAEPRSLRKRDSHTRQYCSPHSPRLHHGAWNEPGRQQLFFYVVGSPVRLRKRLSTTCKLSAFGPLYLKGVLSL